MAVAYEFGLASSNTIAMTVTRTAQSRRTKGSSVSHALADGDLKPQLELMLIQPPARPLTSRARKQPTSPDIKPPVPNVDQMLTMRDVLTITRRHRATIYRWIAAGLFPAPREYKGHQIGWARSDIESWQGSRIGDASVGD